MKRLSEVCKITGVTRRTLQEYDKIGLLSPSKKDQNGYWLYDDIAIMTLMNIQVFVECGYKRREIKRLLEIDSGDQLIAEYDKLIEKLEEKKNRIQGFIVRSKISKSIASETLKNANQDFPLSSFISFLTADKSFKQIVNESVISSGEYTDEDVEVEALSTTLFIHLLSIGVLNKKVSPKSPVVQKRVEKLFNYAVDEEDTDSDRRDEDAIDILQYYLEDEPIHLDSCLGEGTAKFVLEAILGYFEQVKSKTEETEKEV